MHDICVRITECNSDANDSRPVIVAYGAATFSASSSGQCAGPVKGVRKALRQHGVEMYDVYEDYTSQLCSCCHKKLEPMYSEGGEFAIHAVRRCLTANCKCKVWNRDLNAALNILHVFLHESKYGVRPDVFTRRYQISDARATVSQEQ
jgi:hypothetical protein